MLRGRRPSFAFLDGMLQWLLRGDLANRLLQGALITTDAMRKVRLAEAERPARPVRYLRSSGVAKNELAGQTLNEAPVSEGVVCILTSSECCETCRIRGVRQTRPLGLRRERAKCLHICRCRLDGEFGRMGTRLRSGLPHGVQVWINRREWLARKLDR